MQIREVNDIVFGTLIELIFNYDHYLLYTFQTLSAGRLMTIIYLTQQSFSARSASSNNTLLQSVVQYHAAVKF